MDAGGQGDDDATLVARVRAGDPGAFDALFRRHAATVRHVIADNVHNPDDAADVLQEVFLRAYERLDSLSDPARFRPWLLSIARNRAIDRRRQRPRDDIPTDDDHLEIADTVAGPDLIAEHRETAELVRTSLASLAPRDATVLAMVTYLGFSPADVAAAVGVTENNAKVITHRARRRLEDALLLEAAIRRDGEGCDDWDEVRSGSARELARHVASCQVCRDCSRRDVRSST